MTLGNKNCKNSCCAWCFIYEYPGKSIQMQVGNASISLGRGNWIFLHSGWLFGASLPLMYPWVSSLKEVIAGRYFKWNIKCAVTLLLPNSPRFSCQISPWLEKRVSSEVSLHHAAAGLFVWLTIFKNYIFFFFFFLWNMFTVYLALLPLALVLNGTWPSRTVASLDVYIRNQCLFH